MSAVLPTSADILELAQSGDVEATLEWYRRRGQESPYFFSKIIAGYNELTPDLHQPVCQWLVDSEVDRGRGLLFPRKYFKSSMTKGYVLRLLTQPGGSERRILFVGENDDVGAKNLADIQWKLREDSLFQSLYPHLIPPDKGRDWPSSALTVPRSRSYDEPTIQSVGIGTKHTGFHYTDIIYDDPIGLVAASSKLEMKRAIEWFQAAPGLHDSGETQELYVGTRWKHGKADLPGWMMEELPFRIIAGHKEGFKWLKRSAIENGVSIFPPQMGPLRQDGTRKRIGYSLADLASMKKRQKTYLFNANMMNDPTAGDDTDFPESWIRSYQISEDRQALLIDKLDDKGRVIRNERGEPEIERIELASLVRTLVYDPSSGGNSAEAENAMVVIGTDRKARIFVLARWSKNCSFRQAIEQWFVFNDKWKPWQNWYEAVGAHKEVEEILRMCENPCKNCGKNHARIRPRKLMPPPGSKEDRIRDLAQTAMEEGRVYIPLGMTDLRKQITDFPHGDLVDMFDCLAYAISKARKPTIHDKDQAGEEAGSAQPTRQFQPRTFSDQQYGGY